MITICNEEYQEKYNITNGCWCCGTKELTEDIKEVQFVPGSMSKTITLCKKCRNELLNVLKEHDDAEITESITVETKEEGSVSINSMGLSGLKEENASDVINTEENIYAKEMNAGSNALKNIEVWETELNDVPTVIPNDVPVATPNDAMIEDANEIPPTIKELIDEIFKDSESDDEFDLSLESDDLSLEPDFDVEAWVNSLIKENEKADTERSSIISNAVEKVLNPEIPETIAGQKLHMLTVARINPVVFMCKNCEMDYDDEDMKFAKETGDCPYCNVDLTEEYDPDAMLVGKSSLHML